MFKKALIPILCSSFLLSGCDFRPAHKVIEYQEEVKLSDGSFIWVDIKRHYRLAGEPFQKANYLPSIVEISWDTEFPNVGRQSVFFNGGVVLIDKIDNVWYVVGGKPSFDGAYADSNAVNCKDVGIYLQRNACMYALQNNGNLVQYLSNPDLFIAPIKVNVLTLTGLYDWVHNTNKLNNSRLTWSDKFQIDRTIKDKHRQSLGNAFSEF